MCSGSADDFVVRVGIGKWLQHLGTAVLETLLLSDLFLVVDIAESAWNFEIEDKLASQIESFVGSTDPRARAGYGSAEVSDRRPRPSGAANDGDQRREHNGRVRRGLAL